MSFISCSYPVHIGNKGGGPPAAKILSMRKALWAIILLGGLHIGLSLAWAATHPQPPAPLWTPPAEESQAGSGPLTADPDHLDLGKVRQHTETERTFSVRNPGAETVEVLGFDSSCGCTAASIEPRDLPPGGTGKVRVVFSSGLRSGPFRKTVTLKTRPAGELVLSLRGTVLPDFLPEPAVVNFGPVRGPTTRVVRFLKSHPEAAWSFEKPFTRDPQVTARLLDGQLELTVQPQRQGGFSGTVTLPGPRPQHVRYTGEVL